MSIQLLDKDPDEVLRIISEGTASVVGGDFWKTAM